MVDGLADTSCVRVTKDVVSSCMPIVGEKVETGATTVDKLSLAVSTFVVDRFIEAPFDDVSEFRLETVAACVRLVALSAAELIERIMFELVPESSKFEVELGFEDPTSMELELDATASVVEAEGDESIEATEVFIADSTTRTLEKDEGVPTDDIEERNPSEGPNIEEVGVIEAVFPPDFDVGWGNVLETLPDAVSVTEADA